MQKIPTIFKRDPESMKHVLPEVTPGCEWVLAGEGVPTRMYDGTCCMFDGESWGARREVKPGKEPPPNFRPIETDETTGKTVGWEPMEQSAFARWHAEAVANLWGGSFSRSGPLSPGATYELIGPKINGDPERVGAHVLVRHGSFVAPECLRTFDDLRAQLGRLGWEGIVWHHPDGRMAKLKARDFPRERGGE